MSSEDQREESLSSFPRDPSLAFSKWMETMEGFVDYNRFNIQNCNILHFLEISPFFEALT